MDVQELVDRQELIYISFVIWKMFRERWMIGTDGKRESGKSALWARIDDEEDDRLYH